MEPIAKKYNTPGKDRYYVWSSLSEEVEFIFADMSEETKKKAETLVELLEDLEVKENERFRN